MGLNGERLETKNMTTEATVKNYGMKEYYYDWCDIRWLWTGGVKTKVKTPYLIQFQFLANYKLVAVGNS